jgi:hypothetical protein
MSKLHFCIKLCVHRDNDRSSLNCASMLKGGWWWKSCGRGLNGLYLNDPQDLTARQGMETQHLCNICKLHYGNRRYSVMDILPS